MNCATHKYAIDKEMKFWFL